MSETLRSPLGRASFGCGAWAEEPTSPGSAARLEPSRRHLEKVMSSKGFAVLPALVIIIAASGCDNVEWAGVDLELRPPPELDPGPEAPDPELDRPPLRPLDLGPLLYLVRREGGAAASIIPVTELGEDGYRPLPDPDETPDLIERFPLNRWSDGTEFVLLAQSARVGTLVIDGSVASDQATCQVRPRGRGVLELLPGANGEEHFLALRKEDLDAPLHPGSYAGLRDGPELRAGTLNVARLLIPQVQAPWPPSIPQIRRHHAPFPLGDGTTGLAASFVYDGELEVGPVPELAYSLFYLADLEGGAFRPRFSWYQRVRESGKAFPRMLVAHDVMGTGDPDVLLETFGEEHSWYVILGRRGDRWQTLFQDPCGLEIPSGALRSHP